jgi:uncharacterized protein YcfL
MKLLNCTLVLATLVLFSCNSKPKVIVEDSASVSNSSAGVTTSNPSTAADVKTTTTDMHQVIVIEILQAERYTYLKVKENADIFWIATGKLEAKVGNKYFYRGGLLKTNFESQEHKRVFDKIYLVSEVIDAAAHSSSNEEANTNIEAPINEKELKSVVGAIKLSDLFGNKEKYNNKAIIVAGKCVKANYGIMNKNWYHIQDGTKINGKNCDFTITTSDNIPLGANVAFEGKLTLNKDFGSGYKYDVIMEDAKLK